MIGLIIPEKRHVSWTFSTLVDLNDRGQNSMKACLLRAISKVLYCAAE